MFCTIRGIRKSTKLASTIRKSEEKGEIYLMLQLLHLVLFLTKDIPWLFEEPQPPHIQLQDQLHYVDSKKDLVQKRQIPT